MRTLLLLILSLFTHYSLYSQISENKYMFETPYDENGFTFAQIASIVTDNNDLPWFGCDNGLYYYDNKKFTHYSYDKAIPNSLPSNVVTLLYYDSSDRLWVATDNGLCYYDNITDSFTKVKFNIFDTPYLTAFLEYRKGSYLIVVNKKLYTFTAEKIEHLNIVDTNIKDEISAIHCDDEGIVYVGCKYGNIYYSDDSLSSFNQLSSSTKDKITAICRGNNSTIYIGYEDSGVDAISIEGGATNSYRENHKLQDNQLPNNEIKAIVKRADGDIWIGTSSGLAVLDNGKTTIIKASSQNNLPRNSIYTIHVNKKNSIWLGTWAGCIAYYCDNNYRFKYSIKENLDKSNEQRIGHVHHFAPNDDNSTWVGDEWNGISLYDHNTGQYTKNYQPNLRIKSLHKDYDNNLWIGTVFQGLYKMDAKYQYISKIEIPEPFKSRGVLSAITSDSLNNIIWIGTRLHGILQYNTKTREIKTYNNRNTKGMAPKQIWSLLAIEDRLLIASDAGFTIYDYKSDKFTQYKYNSTVISNNCSYSMCYNEHDSSIYIGTKGLGVKVFDLKSMEYKEFEANELLSKYRIYNVMMDGNSLLWFSTNNGIYRYSPETKQLSHFTQSDGLNTLQFHPASCAVTPDNTLIFGSTNGFYYINANKITANEFKPKTLISSVYINNKPLSATNCESVNSLHPADINEIELSHQNNTIAIGVTSNNVLKSDNCNFEYRLLGYQNDWNQLDSNQKITFTKLPFGQYTLELRSSNNDGVWGDTTKVSIKVHAPIYQKWYAIMLYITLIVLLIYKLTKLTEAQIKARKDLEFERQVNTINSKTFDDKLRFFINISHELRTPLSLIKAPLSILEHDSVNKESLIHINAIKRNTERLLRLTNQILDFRLLETGNLKPVISKQNITTLCVDTYSYFEYLIHEHEIKFTFEQPTNTVYASVDGDMIGKVIYNLLSNSLKYSNDGESITLKLECGNLKDKNFEYDIMKGSQVIDDAVIITIKDSGIGIPKSELEQIFDRFYYHTNEAYSSSGIGLHLCLEYVNLHSGHIGVTSKEGIGTTFTVVIPSHTEQPETKQEQTTVLVPFTVTHKDENDSIISSPKSQNKTTILIIDDNSEMRYYLKKMLSQSYNCITAKNGKVGYDLAIDIKPNLIILDVLMPILGGIDCATKLREHPVTKLTPIIMLTGLVDDDKVIQSVKAGADAYISKPIHEPILFAQIERLIERNTSINSTISALEPKNSKKNIGQKSFMKTIEQIMEDNLQNNLLDVNLIAQLLQVSRSTLQRNFKSEIDMGVAEYIRDYRLRSAIKLMESGVYNIDELSTCVGFNSSSYFCRAFKDKYGVSPKKYCDSLKLK